MLMAGIITMQAIRTLLISTVDGKLEETNSLHGMYACLAIIVINLAIHIFYLKMV